MGECGLRGRSVGGNTIFVRFYDHYSFYMTISDSKMGSFFSLEPDCASTVSHSIGPSKQAEVATGDAGGFLVIILPRNHIRDYKTPKNIDRFIKYTPKSNYARQKLNRSRDLHFFETSSFRFKHGPGVRRSVMTTQAEVTFPHERYLQLICLFMLVSVKKKNMERICACLCYPCRERRALMCNVKMVVPIS